MALSTHNNLASPRNWKCGCKPGLLGPPASPIPPSLRSIVEATATGPPTTWRLSSTDDVIAMECCWPADQKLASPKLSLLFPPALLTAVHNLNPSKPSWTVEFAADTISCSLSWSSVAVPSVAEPSSPVIAASPSSDAGYFSASPSASPPASPSSPLSSPVSFKPVSPIAFSLPPAVSEPTSTVSSSCQTDVVAKNEKFPKTASSQRDRPSSVSTASQASISTSCSSASCQTDVAVQVQTTTTASQCASPSSVSTSSQALPSVSSVACQASLNVQAVPVDAKGSSAASNKSTNPKKGRRMKNSTPPPATAAAVQPVTSNVSCQTDKVPIGPARIICSLCRDVLGEAEDFDDFYYDECDDDDDVQALNNQLLGY